MTAGSVSVPQVIPLRIPLPGKAKHEIDTNTLIEIKSDTPEVSIYYTLDGSKPELIRKPGYGECNTFKYKGPIILPVGKIMVKALAVTKDCRKSTVVTKVFLVEYKQPNILFSVEDDDKNFLKDIATRNKEGGMFTTKPKKNGLNVEIKPAWGEAPQDFQERKTSHRSLQGPQLLASHLGTTQYREESVSAPPTESLQFASSSAVTSRKSLASTQVSRIQRETDFLKCAHCSEPRLSNPLAHFCQKCGSPIPPVPVHRFPLPEGRQMAPCLECKHPVPMNTPTCIVCESPIAPQLQPQNNTCIKGKVICQVCGTGNPLHHKHCATCESRLPEIQTPMFGGDTPPPYHSQQRKTVSCSKCHHVNQCDARFCDWCGAKPGPPPSYFTCFKCGTSNQPYARFCASCGVYIEPPSRRGSPSGSLMDPGDSLGSSEAKQLQAQVAWQPHPVSMTKSRPELTEREDKGTQTIGLFYPSSKQLEKKELELILQKEKLEKMNDHKPLLTAISPGKGYWRKQLDHVCAHLRSYAQNNLEFRALIGEPRMGKCTFSVNYTGFTRTQYCFLTGDVVFRKSPNCIKMINGVTARRCKLEILPKESRKIGLINSATICEDDYEVTITLNYVLAINKDIHTNKPVKFSNHYLNTVTEVRDGKDRSQTSFGKDDCNLFHSRGKIKRTKSRTLTGQEDKLSKQYQMKALSSALDFTMFDSIEDVQLAVLELLLAQYVYELDLFTALESCIDVKLIFTHLLNQDLNSETESRQLLDELGPNGKGRITFIEELLNEGADPNCINDMDQPALTVAVLNKHTEAICFLVQRGADIDQQSGLHSNTALHEAVLLGSEGEECIRALLCCNANTQKKNAEGQSAYDLAVTTGNDEVISLFQVRSDREHWTNL